MQDKIKNIIITIGFIIIILGVFITNIIAKDKEISTTERRKLAQLPKVSMEKIINGDTMEAWDKYVTDQFIGRDLFRTIKSFWSMNVFRQKDNNDLFVISDSIYKMEYPLSTTRIEKSADKINAVYQKYLQNMNVYYAIIPDKNYYLENDDHLKFDYEQIKQIMENKLPDMNYIDIWKSLELEDYYKTDLHWKQENIQNVVQTIQNNMNLESTAQIEYIEKDMGDFYGTYYGQLGLNLPPDKLKVLTNETTVLSAANETTILESESAQTTVLNQETTVLQNETTILSNNSYDSSFKIEIDITYIHTNEIIGAESMA